MKINRKSVAFISLIALCVAIFLASGCARKVEVKAATNVFPPVSVEPTISEPPLPPVWPLTGLDAPDSKVILSRPLSVKIENSSLARPQSSIVGADIVYESMVEGGMTRFNCIYHSTIPKQVGPVRSARLSDAWIVPQYNTILLYSGANSEVLRTLDAQKVRRLTQGLGNDTFLRVGFRSAPHNLYLNLKNVLTAAEKRGIKITWEPRGPKFGLPSLESKKDATEISIPFGGLQTTGWKWDSEKSVYKRSNNGKTHIDKTTGGTITSTNVVVMWATYRQAAKKDPAGNPTYDTKLGGTGKASIFKDGMRIDGTWKAGRDTPPSFVDSSGSPILLNPGVTWFEVVPSDKDITVSSSK